jgi:protein gp37
VSTSIEWVVALAAALGMEAGVWNPIRGCRPASDGCRNCWAARVADMRARNPHPKIAARHQGLTTRTADGRPVFNGTVHVLEDQFAVPLATKRPTVWFVCSEADLFAAEVCDDVIDRVLGVEALAPQHLYLHLTKRAGRMRDYFADELRWALIEGEAQAEYHSRTAEDPSLWLAVHDLPRSWFGVSIENQAAADERVPALLATPAVKRFLSCEPLLGPVDITWALSRNPLDIAAGFLRRGSFSPGLESLRRLDWVVAGGESGPGSRPCHPDWALSLRDQAEAAGVPFFWKQWGEWAPAGLVQELDGRRYREMEEYVEPENGMYRVGKKAAGRQLDGREHLEVPAL